MPAAGVRLHVTIGHGERRRRRQQDRPRLAVAPEREGLRETVDGLEHMRRSFDAVLREQCCLQALARGVTGMKPLDVGSAVDEGEQARRAAGGNAESVRGLLRRQLQQPCRGGGRAEYAGRAGRMKTALAQIGMAGGSDRGNDFVADDGRLKHRAAARSMFVGERDHRGDHGDAGMHRTLAITVVELDAVTGRAGDEGCVQQIRAPFAAGHRNAAEVAHRPPAWPRCGWRADRTRRQ